MKKKITILFHSEKGCDIKEFTIKRFFLWFGSFFALIFTLVVCVLGFDYFNLKRSSLKNVATTIEKQKSEIHIQRQQIQDFAFLIENLKNKLKNLSEFENKIRIIAAIGKGENLDPLIAIGGLPGESIDQEISLDQNHNNLMREIRDQIRHTENVIEDQTLSLENLIATLEKKRNLLDSTPSIRPVKGWISSSFGHRNSPFTGLKELHSGLDIANKNGTIIIAPANGKVSYVGRKRYIGKLLVIDHGYGKVTRYGHLEKILVKRGQEIKRGDKIALLGNTGRSTGPHLHYEVKVDGVPVNPLKYILN